MGEEGATRALKQALAMGVDEGVLLHDAAFANADATSTAYVLAEAIKKIGTYQLILCGRQASDWDQAQVPSGIAEFLGLPSVTAVQKVSAGGRDPGATPGRWLYEVLDVRPPCLVTISNEANKPLSRAQRHYGYRQKDSGVEYGRAWRRSSASRQCWGTHQSHQTLHPALRRHM